MAHTTAKISVSMNYHIILECSMTICDCQVARLKLKGPQWACWPMWYVGIIAIHYEY